MLGPKGCEADSKCEGNLHGVSMTCRAFVRRRCQLPTFPGKRKLSLLLAIHARGPKLQPNAEFQQSRCMVLCLLFRQLCCMCHASHSPCHAAR